MKKLTTLFVAVLMISATTIFAQGNPNAKMKPINFQKVTPEQRAKTATDSLQKIVGLTDAQYNSVLEINKKFFEDKKAMHTQMRLDTATTAIEKFNTDEKQLKQARKQSIENLLTAEQKTKWQAHKKQFMQEKKKNMPPKPKQGAGPGPGPKPIENDIDLD